MQIDTGLDTGDMLLKWETEIGPEDNALGLGARLAKEGAALLVETLRENPAPVKQDPAEATYAPILKKEDGEIDWSCRRPKSLIDRAGFCRGRVHTAFFAPKYFTFGRRALRSAIPSAIPVK